MRNNINRILCAGLLGALWSGAPAEGKLTDLSYQRVGQGVLIEAQGQNLPSPKVLRLNGNRSYMLEFRDTALAGSFKRVRVRYGGVQYATAGWYSAKPPVVRVHVWLSPKLNPELSQTEKGWTISVNAPAPAAKPPQPEAEPFPSRVPPLEKAPAARPVRQEVRVYEESEHVAGHAAPKPAKPIYVTLDFSGTEVVQIIKALAMQSGVNIIAGPEVQGKINVTLKKVELTEALDYVTTLAGLRYAKIGKTYVVTSSARFAEAMQQLAGKLEDAGETRVVQLASGEGTQIKAAAYKALPQYTTRGSYDIILPTEAIMATSSTGVGKSQGAGSAAGGAASTETKGQAGAGQQGEQSNQGGVSASQTIGTTEVSGMGVKLEAKSREPEKGAKDPYLVVVGAPERLEEVIAFVKKLDRELATAANVGPNRDIATRVVPVYSGEVERIREALQSIINRDARASAFKLSDNVGSSQDKGQSSGGSGGSGGSDTVGGLGASAGGSDKPASSGSGTKVTSRDTASKVPKNPLIFLAGPKDALDGLVEIAGTMDRGICDALGLPYPKDFRAQRQYEVIGLKSIDPDQAMLVLNSHLPRLTVDYVPSGVGTTVKSQTKTSVEPGNAAARGGSSVDKLGVETDSTPMEILVYGTAEEIAAAKKLLATVDVPAKQIALELRVMELSREDALKVGLDWSLLTGGTLKSIRVNQGLSAGSGTVGSLTGELKFNDGATLDVLGKLDLLNDSNKLISRPNILATDGRRTRIFIGDTVRYVESIQSSQNGVTVTSKELPVGVEMNVLARVGADNSINLDLTPSFTLLKGFTSVPGGGSLPQTSTREAHTQMTIRDGETIAIGGLIQQQDIKTIGGIPLLRDIPLLGELFKRTETNKIKKEVVFFLTAKVVDNANRAYAAHPRAGDDAKMPEPPSAK